MKINLTKTIEESFAQYAGAVLQSRAMVDVRDGIKPSARQIFYAMYTDKFTHDKPFQKTLKAVGSAFRFYIHGDSSCVGIIMRAGQPFAIRYPLVKIDGSYGNLMESGNWASARYTESRLSELSDLLFKDIKKNTIKEWRNNYDDTEQYPAVLPAKGFYPIVLGTFGIGVGASASIPPTNLAEVNAALVKLLWNPDVSFDEIYCAPDFPTGGVLLNASEVKESLRTGRGKSCRIRSVVDYVQKEHALVVTEVPYFVYTNTVCAQLESLIESEENPGIEKFIDLTGENPLLKIYLKKGANPDYVLSYLYKKTALESFYSVNLTMLDKGRYPKTFTWKEALLAYLAHQVEVYTYGYQYDLEVARKRLHIVEGYIKAISIIDKVVSTIRSSENTSKARENLRNLDFSEEQAKAILELKLARLVKLDLTKYENEASQLKTLIRRITEILGDETLLKKEIEKDLVNTIARFGDERRTVIQDITTEDAEEVVEEVQLICTLTDKQNLYISESSTLYTKKRGQAGQSLKLSKDENILDVAIGTNLERLYLFGAEGTAYPVNLNSIPTQQKKSVQSLISKPEKILKIATIKMIKSDDFFYLVTKKGVVKKSVASEILPKARGVKIINLQEDDEIISILKGSLPVLGLATEKGQLILTNTDDYTAVGRSAKGVSGIKLNPGDKVVAAFLTDTALLGYLYSATKNGYAKGTELKEFRISGRNGKGVLFHGLDDNDSIADAFVDTDLHQIIIHTDNKVIRLHGETIPILSRTARGTKMIKMGESNEITAISNFHQ